MAVDLTRRASAGPRPAGRPGTGGAPGADGRPDADGTRGDERTAAQLAGLDALDLPVARRAPLAQRTWAATWPKAAAIAIAVGLWQAVVLSGWRPDYVLPGPVAVAQELLSRFQQGEFWEAVAITMTRALTGFALAVLLGVGLGIAVSRVRPLRAAIGSLITGLQTMPSVAWFPLAILLFQLSERAILFVVVLGAAPSIANGLINGVDYVPTLLKRVGTNLGARGLTLYRHVVLPAALPSFVGGLKQGWAFAWRSLMAGELIAIIAERQSIGFLLDLGRETNAAESVIALMIVILVIGICVDAVFGRADAAIRRRWGLSDPV